jgi:hypothetical protein
MGSAERCAGRELGGECEGRKVELLHSMRRCVAAAEHNSPNSALLDQFEQKAPERGAEFFAVGSSGRRSQRGVEDNVTAGS